VRYRKGFGRLVWNYAMTKKQIKLLKDFIACVYWVRIDGVIDSLKLNNERE
jgi:hypothetical protein